MAKIENMPFIGGKRTEKMGEQEFLDACIIPDKTPIRYGDDIIGHTVGNNDCKKLINAVIYPFRTSVNFKAQDFIEGKINVTDLALVFGEVSK